MDILKSKLLVWFLLVTGALLLASLAFVYFNIGSLSDQIILHFDAFKGIDLFGTHADFWSIWGGGVLIILLNVFLAEAFFFRERMVTYLLLGTNILLSLLLFLSVTTIVAVN